MEKVEKVVLTKNGVQKEFTKKAAEIAVENLGWSELPPIPPELLGKGPILLKRPIQPPEVKELKDDPEFANMPEEYLERNKIPVEQRPGHDPDITKEPPVSEVTQNEPVADASQVVEDKPKVKRSPRKK